MKRSRKVKKKNKQHHQKKLKMILFFSILLLVLGTIYIFITDNEEKVLKKEKIETMYLASTTNLVELFALKQDSLAEENVDSSEKILILESVKEVPRGLEIRAKEKKVTYEENTYRAIMVDEEEFYVDEDFLVKEEEDVVLEKTLFVRTATSILESLDSSKIVGLAKKGESMEVLSYNEVDEEGNVGLYEVKLGDVTGYVYGKYVTISLEDSLLNYMPEVNDAIHGKIKNTYGGGEAIKLDFYPNEKPVFENNKMPDSVYALYLNCGSNTLQNIDDYIAFAKETKINAFVVDIKDNETPAYPAKVFESLSPTNYQHAIHTYEEYKNAITKLKDAGFYVIGRITVFKDSYYVKDHPEDAIVNKNNYQPYLHNGSYWPSAYDRDVWYFNVSLAKEAVEEFGFDEINFDYVRFPDRMNSVSSIVDLKNTYEEDKVEAIQRFVQYATDVLHEKEVYVSIDVFGETTNGTYTTAYGQYWPAISNVADVISGTK